MVAIQQTRTFNITETKAKLNALVTDAERGLVTHIVTGGRVVAHLVPGNARIIDDDRTLEAMLQAVLERSAAEAVRLRASDGRLTQLDDSLGRVLAWCWRTDPEIFTSTLKLYLELLGHQLVGKVGLADLRPALDRALAVRLDTSETVSAISYADGRWQE